MISSELEISYSSTGRLQVKVFGVSKKLCHRLTTEKGTGEMRINRNLQKEIKTALRKSKYKKVEINIYEKRKELKGKQYKASRKETEKKIIMDENNNRKKLLKVKTVQ